jgi:malate dehydrogenase (oxaloacetate-decarboxylating)(NADP+)
MKKLKGKALLQDPVRNKSTAFTRREREALSLRGLLPWHVSDMEAQQRRVLGNLRRKSNAIEKYIFLNALQDRNQCLFYRTVIDHIEELLPLIYTPTVGAACREFASIFRQSQGFYVTPDDRGEIRRILDNWPEDSVRVIVVTDGERILGLGDLGANGMGIPIGKLALYVACGGIPLQQCLPVMLDTGTNNESLRVDPLYLGWPRERLRGEAYYSLVDELIAALQDRYPEALIQFEDFSGHNAFTLLERYRSRVRMFNDDIQGTAAMALAGVYAANRVTGTRFEHQRILFLGAGGAATGIATLMARAFEARGLSRDEAYRRIWLVDADGLVTADRKDLDDWLAPFAQARAPLDLNGAIDALRPHALIGATGVAGTFTPEAVQRMAAINERPVVFALSNPTANAECTAEQAYRWSDGRALYASGSQFDPVELDGQVYQPGQANNAYIFPGVGLGVAVSGASRVPDTMFLVAAEALAASVEDESLKAGTLFPPLTRIREVSERIARSVFQMAIEEDFAPGQPADAIAEAIASYMYDPRYERDTG